MKNTDQTLREKIDAIIVDCLTTGETEREASKATYGSPNYWTDQIMALFTETMQEIIGMNEIASHINKVNDLTVDVEKSIRNKLRLEQRKLLEEIT